MLLTLRSLALLVSVPIALVACVGDRTDDGPTATTSSEILTSGRTLRVCAHGCAYTDIQAAIDAAVDGDVVRIARGHYAGPIHVTDKSITVRGDGRAATVVSGGGPVLAVTCATSVEVVVADMTFTGGGGIAGGVVNDGCSLTLRSAAVTSNAVHASGAGIRNAGTLRLTDVLVVDNLARVAGGGLYNEAGASARVKDCWFERNTSGIGAGGAILNEGDLVVRDSVLTGNAGKFGAGLANDGTATVRDSVVRGNHATLTGGGIQNGGTLVVEGSRIVRNEAGTSGGGIYEEDGATATLVDSTIRANVPDDCVALTCH
jgi:hypothetical protein